MLTKGTMSALQDLRKFIVNYRTLLLPACLGKNVKTTAYMPKVSFSDSSETTADDLKREESTEAKPFESIPALPRLPIINHLHHFGPFGPYSVDKLQDAFHDLHLKYGPIVRLDLGINMVALYDPSDIQKLFKGENNDPKRPVFEALRKYRLSKKHTYSSAGLFTENGGEWYRLRKSVKWMMLPQFAHTYLSAQEKIADSFVCRMRFLRNNSSEIPDFLQELYRYTEEAVGLVCFGTRLGLVEASDTESNTRGLKIVKAVDDGLQAMADTLLGFPWWKFFNTPTYNKMKKSQDFITKFAMECASYAKAQIDAGNTDTNLEFLRKLVTNKGLTLPDITLLVTDIFGAGIDATGNAIGYLLYNLAKKPDAQEKIFQEMQNLRVNLEPITKAKLDSLKYLKACIKENYRLTPSSSGNARILSAPAIFSGYQVPENVLCIGMNPTICRQREHFEDPLSYKPERWINRESGGLERVGHPFCVMPFGHGPRRCIGQRFAEQEIRLCAIKIIQNFKVEYDGPEIGAKTRLMLTPDKPLNFRFIDRN